MTITLDDLKEAMQIAETNGFSIAQFELTPENIANIKQECRQSNVKICTRIVEKPENAIMLVRLQDVKEALKFNIIPPNIFKTAENNDMLWYKYNIETKETSEC